MEENVKPKTAARVKEKRQVQDAIPKRNNKHQGLIKNDLSHLSPPQPFDSGSPIKKLFSEASKIVKIGLEKEYALLERDTTLQNSNETIDNLRKNMLHLQMEYEKLDQNFQKEISCRTEIVKRMDATRELVESVVQCSSVLGSSIKQLEDDKLKIAEFYELIYQNQKEVEAKHGQNEKFLKEQDELLKAKFREIKNCEEKILSQHAETVSQLKKKLTYAENQLKITAYENEKLGKSFQECQDSSSRLQCCLDQQEKLNYFLQESVEQFKRNLRFVKTQRFRCQKLLKKKRKQLSAVLIRNKNLKKSLDRAEVLYGECLSANKVLKSKNDEWRNEFEKHLNEDSAEREAWEAQKKELINKLSRREAELGDLKAENKSLTEKISDVTSSEGAKRLELEQVQNELSKMLNENLNLKENVAKLSEENTDKAKTISEMEMKSVAAGVDLNSQIEFYKNECGRLEETVRKMDTQLQDVQETLAQERTEHKNKISEFNNKLEENLKLSREKICNLEKLLQDKADYVQKLESERTYAALSGKTALENLGEELQAEKLKNTELNKSLDNVKKAREEVSKQLEAATKRISDCNEKLEELKSLNKTLQRSQIETERVSEDLKREMELGKKRFSDLEEKYQKAERELSKLQKTEEENAGLKSSTAELKSLLENTEARLEAYKMAVKKLEIEKAQSKNHHTEEMSRLKMELTRLEEALKKEKRREDAPQSSFEISQSKRGTPSTRSRDISAELSQKLNTKENDTEVGRDVEKRQQATPPVQSAKKFLSTPRNILTSTPNFRNITPLHRKRDPYEFDSDSSVEHVGPSKVLKVFSRQKKETNKRSKPNKDNENFRKSDLVLIKPASHMTLSTVIENESSHVNSIMYSCINNDPTVAESQFSKLKNWINELNPLDIREELKALLFPLLCHLYIEMLRGGHERAAATFLKTNQSISTEEEAIGMLEELASVESTKDIEEKDIIQSLRSSKYLLLLSPKSIEILKQYLIRKSHVILLQMINCWFDIEEKKSGDSSILESEENEPINQPCNGYPEIQQSDGDLAKLEEIIRLVNDVPSSSGPLLLYSVFNPDNCMTCGHVSDDTVFLAAGFNTSEIKLWSLTEKKLLSHKPCSSSRVRLAVDIDEPETENININTPVDSITLRSHSGQVQDLAFIHKEDILISVSMDKTMRVWDLKTYSCRATYRGHNYPIWAVDVSPLGVYVATGSHDKTARLWSLERNYPLRIFAGHVQDVDCLKFHPNGSYLATGSSDKSVRLWSTSSGELMRVLPGHRGGICALSFSPNGKLLASAGEDKRIKIWDIASSNVITELKGHSGTVISLDWSQNGEFLASCSFDNTCRIWHMKNCSSEDQAVLQLPEVHNISCNSLFSVKYSSRNTPICIAGV